MNTTNQIPFQNKVYRLGFFTVIMPSTGMIYDLSREELAEGRMRISSTVYAPIEKLPEAYASLYRNYDNSPGGTRVDSRYLRGEHYEQ